MKNYSHLVFLFSLYLEKNAFRRKTTAKKTWLMKKSFNYFHMTVCMLFDETT